MKPDRRTKPHISNRNDNRAAYRPTLAAELTVRPAAFSDAVPLQFFFDTLLRRDYFLRRGQLAEMLRGRYHQIWAAEIDSILVGIAITTHGTRLVNVLVHPAYRGLGIGRALVAASGAREVRAKLNMSTGDPRGFYAALGFEPVGPVEAGIHIIDMQRKTGGLPRNDGAPSHANAAPAAAAG